jgi:hypothetical protein
VDCEDEQNKLLQNSSDALSCCCTFYVFTLKLVVDVQTYRNGADNHGVEVYDCINISLNIVRGVISRFDRLRLAFTYIYISVYKQ